ncbi:MAG: sensor histidine kinase, partial [Lachnospiraceae bacterium]|nr:sensor histidine kinase [Lachnospiraceae bacterium]
SSYLLLLYTEKYIKKMEIESDSRFCWYLLIMPAASLTIMVIFIYMEFPSSTMIQILVCGGTFLLYVSNAAVFVILSNLTQEMKRNKLLELSELKRELERRNFERIEQANEVYRKFLHDVHHYYAQFRSLAVQGETQTIVGIIDELEGKLATEEKPVFYIADPVVNSVLIEYEKQAKEQGVKCSVFVEKGLDIGFISDGDKISMFGNLLLNAIEAAAGCAEGERSMQAELFMGNRNVLVLRIENTFCHELRIEDGCDDKRRKSISLLSTKPDAGSHGLGIGIVRELAKKYGGSLTLSREKGRFTAVLTLSRRMGQNTE